MEEIKGRGYEFQINCIDCRFQTNLEKKKWEKKKGKTQIQQEEQVQEENANGENFEAGDEGKCWWEKKE